MELKNLQNVISVISILTLIDYTECHINSIISIYKNRNSTEPKTMLKKRMEEHTKGESYFSHSLVNHKNIQ